MVDVLGALPAVGGWVPNNAPPGWPSSMGGPLRLVDSISLCLLGSLLAATLTLTIRPGTPRRTPADPG